MTEHSGLPAVSATDALAAAQHAVRSFVDVASADLVEKIDAAIAAAFRAGYETGRGAAAPSDLDALLESSVTHVLAKKATPSFFPSRDVVRVEEEHDDFSQTTTVFHRADYEVRPDAPTAIRVEASRMLSDEEHEILSHLLAYTYAATVRGEPIGRPRRDSDYSQHFLAQTTLTRRSDLDAALAEFECSLDAYLLHGSPVRKSDRSGPGTAGTRAVGGLDDPDLRLAVYYDRVQRIVS